MRSNSSVKEICNTNLRILLYIQVSANQLNESSPLLAHLRPAERIFQGAGATPFQYPFVALVAVPIHNGQFFICSGSIISRNWVLTAAHCTFRQRQFNLRFGSLQLWSGGDAQTSRHAITHHRYDPNTLDNDIAVIAIPHPLTFTQAIQRIRLPIMQQINMTFPERLGVVAGWGQTGEGPYSTALVWAPMRLINHFQCPAAINDPNTDLLCAVGQGNINRGHCFGDGGAPLAIREERNIWTQVGVATFFRTNNGCGRNVPSHYVRTSRFLRWIAANTDVPVRFT